MNDMSMDTIDIARKNSLSHLAMIPNSPKADSASPSSCCVSARDLSEVVGIPAVDLEFVDFVSLRMRAVLDCSGLKVCVSVFHN